MILQCSEVLLPKFEMQGFSRNFPGALGPQGCVWSKSCIKAGCTKVPHNFAIFPSPGRARNLLGSGSPAQKLLARSVGAPKNLGRSIARFKSYGTFSLGQMHRRTDTQKDRHTDGQTHRRTDTQTDWHTDGQTHRRTDISKWPLYH